MTGLRVYQSDGSWEENSFARFVNKTDSSVSPCVCPDRSSFPAALGT